jgi:hypothetical protein
MQKQDSAEREITREKIESMLLEIKEANKVGFWKAIRKDRNTNIIKS